MWEKLAARYSHLLLFLAISFLSALHCVSLRLRDKFSQSHFPIDQLALVARFPGRLHKLSRDLRQPRPISFL
jgi:hypothetical protein